MPKISIDFKWFRDSKGFEIISHGRDEMWVVRKGGALVSFKPLRIETLYRVFADVRTENQLLDFVNKNGPLTKARLEAALPKPKARNRRSKNILTKVLHAGERVNEGLREAEMFRNILAEMDQARRTGKSWWHMRPKPLKIATARLRTDSNGVRIEFVPDDLIDAMRLQLAAAASSGGEDVVMCRECGQPFTRGPGTGRRSDSRFCSNAHKILYNSKKRTRKPK
jgi:hypothetical protein